MYDLIFWKTENKFENVYDNLKIAFHKNFLKLQQDGLANKIKNWDPFIISFFDDKIMSLCNELP